MSEGSDVETEPEGMMFPEGKLEAPVNIQNNYHEVISKDFVINGQNRELELIHQLRPGDCVLANFLNTWSVENNGKLPMTINETRQAAINLRRDNNEGFADIINPNSPLSYIDTVRLFETIHNVPVQQEDVLTVEGRRSLRQSKLDALSILDYLDTYSSGLCTTGLGSHSRTIKKLEGDNYLLIDPMNQDGLTFLNTEGMMNFLSSYINGHPEDANFFLFLRK